MNYFGLSEKEKRQFLEAAAGRLGIEPRILEKDVWVCWSLRELFSLPEGAPRLAFKGGTSLSKVFGAIERFSEDVDVTVDYRFLGIKGDPHAEGLSQGELDRLLKQFVVEAARYISEDLLPRFAGRLEKDGGGEVRIGDDPLNLEVFFVSALATEAGYIRDHVRIEFGAKNSTEPSEIHRVRPDAAKAGFPVELPESDVTVLSPVRTFWEKATLAHAEFHRPQLRASAERMSRHWYDLARLARHEIGERALQHLDMLGTVAEHKRRFFRAGWARYETALQGTLRLVPHAGLASMLRDDYAKMQENRMFVGEPPSFDEILSVVQELERSINAAG